MSFTIKSLSSDKDDIFMIKKYKYSGKSYINRQHGFIPTTASAFGNF